MRRDLGSRGPILCRGIAVPVMTLQRCAEEKDHTEEWASAKNRVKTVILRLRFYSVIVSGVLQLPHSRTNPECCYEV
jgi:hypothetical protein